MSCPIVYSKILNVIYMGIYIKSCKKYDLVHDLALLVSRGETLIWDTSCNIDENSTIRHLRVEYDGEVLPTIPRSIAQRLHSLFSNVDVYCSIVLDLRNLRSLKLLKGGKKIELTPSLNKLKHLRYLDASETSVKVPPQCFTICRLLMSILLRSFLMMGQI
ncbi:hypothetical protein SLA2020_409190 [Shorea laevis]